ncbi:MAG: hypothetical protein ABH826_05365 [Patescibacteria group bacterium]
MNEIPKSNPIEGYGFASSDDDIELERPEAFSEDDVELAEPEDHDVEETEIGEPEGFDADGETITPEAFNLPDIEEPDNSQERIRFAEESIALTPDFITEEAAHEFNLDETYQKDYLPAMKNLAVLNSNQEITKQYLEKLLDRKKQMENLAQKGISDPNEQMAEASMAMAKEDLTDNAETISQLEGVIDNFKTEFNKRENKYLVTFPPLESPEEQQTRIEDAQMQALEGRGIFNHQNAKELGMEEEHQNGYIPARQELFVLKSDVKLMQTYLQRLRERNANLKASGVTDTNLDKANKLEAAIRQEMGEKMTIIKELNGKLEAFEEEVRREMHRRETGMPVTTTPEAMKDAAADLTKLAAKGAALGGAMAATVAAKGIWETEKLVAKGAKKVARAPGAAAKGVATGGAVTTGFFVGTLVAFSKAVMDAFFPNRKK